MSKKHLHYLRPGIPIYPIGNDSVKVGSRPDETLIFTGISTKVRSDLLCSVQDGSPLPPQLGAEIIKELNLCGFLLENEGALEKSNPPALSLSNEAALLHQIDGTHIALEQRKSAGIKIIGADFGGGALATLLAASGVGRIEVVDKTPVGLAPGWPFTASDTGQTRANAALRQGAALRSGTLFGPINYPTISVYFSSFVPQLDLATCSSLALPVIISEFGAQIGPLLGPGRACQNCYFRNWINALGTESFTALLDTSPAVSAPTECATIASLVGQSILAFLDNRPHQALETSLEIIWRDPFPKLASHFAKTSCSCPQKEI